MTHLYVVQHGAAKTQAEDPLGEKPRAKETAEILAARLRPTEGIKEIPGIAPNDDIEPMRARLENESSKLMLVGHLPYLSRLAARLLGLGADRTVVQFQMGGVVRMDRDERWPLGCVLGACA
jgi:phosphohistidine phosphatase